jgi:peptidoglycan-N-acetylglucosamine deacetylase
MSQGTVCLTFDFDAVSLWMVRGMTTPSPVSRGEFGAVAVPRILDLLGERGIESTWFIPGHTVETYRDLCEEVTRISRRWIGTSSVRFSREATT